MKSLYADFPKAKRELRDLISEISQELQRLKLLIAHAEHFIAPAEISTEEYRDQILGKIEKLSHEINNIDDVEITEEMAERLTEFNSQCLHLSQGLETMRQSPDLVEEGEVYHYCLHRFAQFAHDLPNDPNRVEVFHAIKEASTLLENINAGLTLINANAALLAAEAMTNGCKVLDQMQPELKSGFHSIQGLS